MAEPESHLDDTAVAASVSVQLRLLQMRLFNQNQKVSRIITPQARAVRAQLIHQGEMVAAIAYALEEGRLEIREPDEDTMAARMAVDVDLHFGVTDQGDSHGAGE